jgi:O-antigen ligase
MFITDTFWPQILGEMGVGGLVTYATFIGWMGVMLWREADRRDDGEFRRVFRFAAGMVFAQTIIESFASSMFHSPPRVYLVFLVIGAVGSMAWRIRAAEARDGPAEAAPATEPTAIGSG